MTTNFSVKVVSPLLVLTLLILQNVVQANFQRTPPPIITPICISSCSVPFTFPPESLPGCTLWGSNPIFSTSFSTTLRLPTECIAFGISATRSCGVDIATYTTPGPPLVPVKCPERTTTPGNTCYRTTFTLSQDFYAVSSVEDLVVFGTTDTLESCPV
jgi:hypothetical protein